MAARIHIKLIDVLALGVVLSLAGCAVFQNNTAAQQELAKASQEAASKKEAVDDLLRKGDGLIIRLSSVPVEDQGVFEVRVDEGGQVSMPYIGSIHAEGLTGAELKKRIEKAYRDQKIFTNPNVGVVTVERRYVDISGEVKIPQRVMYTKDLTAYGAIASSGGFTDYADRRRVKLLRGDKVIEFNAIDVAKDPSKDILLQPNDKISVGRSVF